MSVVQELHDAARSSETPTVAQVAKWIREFKEIPGNEVGGTLHIVVDDGNVADKDIWFCYGYAAGKGDDVGVDLTNILLRLSKTGRRKAVGS